ncbi:unnamed protein product [Trichogramma brassicae]|uniref:Uncharacterized protein n=1 Tax=Trichogramma brassicae TaxID=86971 RepID=A0A6H5HWF7_9HYME|nr:unnamed protein product [Trichogramma brassicae]
MATIGAPTCRGDNGPSSSSRASRNHRAQQQSNARETHAAYIRLRSGPTARMHKTSLILKRTCAGRIVYVYSSSRVRIYALQWRRRTRPMQSIEEKTAPRASAPPLTPLPTQLLLFAVHLYFTNNADNENLEKLEKMREEVDWKNVHERRSFFHQFRQLSVRWEHHLPDLREFFKREEMDWMLMQCAPGKNVKNAVSFVSFVVRTGYKDDPPLDESGKPLVRRNTPVHNAFSHSKGNEKLTRELFKIYDSFYVNYVSNLGITHFHTACLLGFYDVVQGFLAFHQDPNSLMKLDFVGQKFIYTPLYWASMNENGKEVIKLLLEYGAKATLPSATGKTPLHVICSEDFSDEHRFEMLEILLKTCDLKHFPKNEQGIPLQLALLKRLPNMIDRLVDYGALSSFVFPSQKKFNESVTNIQLLKPWDRLEVASRTLATVERLENRGYKLDRSDAMTVMKFLIYRLNFTSNEEQKEKNYESWRYDTSFMTVAKKKKITIDELSPTLYDLTRSPPSEPKDPLTYEDYFKLSRSCRLRSKLPSNVSEACAAYLFEKMSAGFFRRWTLGPFMMKTDQRYSQLDCMNVFKAMKCQDLLQRYGLRYFA